MGILFLHLLTYSRVSAQYSIEWKICLAGSKDDVISSIKAIPDGGYIFAGWSESNDGDFTSYKGAFDMILGKVDAAGKIIWRKNIGGSSHEGVLDFQLDEENNIILVGNSGSSDKDFIENKGQSDYCVVKLDPSGNIIWQKSYGGNDIDIPSTIQKTSDGGFIISGCSKSQGLDKPEAFGDFDYWIVKIDKQGNLIWQKSYGGSSFDNAFHIKETPTGDYIIVGESSSSDIMVDKNRGKKDLFILKIDKDGKMLWSKTMGGSDLDIPYAVEVTADDHYIIAAESKSIDGDVSANKGSVDFWIIKIDNKGNVIWQKNYGGSNADIAYSLSVQSEGSIIIAGITISSDGDVKINHGDYDLWLIKINADGKLLSQQSFGGSLSDYSTYVKYVENNSLVLAGYTHSSDKIFSSNKGLRDAFILKLTNNSSSTSNVKKFDEVIFSLKQNKNFYQTEELMINVYNLDGSLKENFNPLELVSFTQQGIFLVEVIEKKSGSSKVFKLAKN